MLRLPRQLGVYTLELIVLVSHLPGVCVFRSFACSAHMPLVTRTRLGPGCMLGRSLPLGSTLVFRLVLGTFLALFRSACFNQGQLSARLIIHVTHRAHGVF